MRAFIKEKSGYLIKSLVGLIIVLASALCMSLVSYAEDKLAKPIVIAETILNSQYSTYWDGNSSHNLISWDKVVGANMYYVYRRDNSKSKFSYLAKTTSTEYKDTKIKDNTTYYYIVKAVKALNGKATLESDYSDVAHCITGLKRFPELTIYPSDDTNIAIGIKGSSADDYVIFYSDDKGKSYKEIRLLNYEAHEILKPGSAGITELSGYVIGDLEPDKTYYIKVQTADIDNGKIIRRKGTSDIVQVKTRKSSEIISDLSPLK